LAILNLINRRLLKNSLAEYSTMKKALLAVIIVLLIGGAYIFLQPSMKEGVKAYSIVDLAEQSGIGSGTCAAKLENTNSYSVNVTYKFSGIESKTVKLNESTTAPVEGVGCSEPSMKIIDVEKLS
jgi:ABC-type Na+ efflux pump permease subunit